MGLGHIRICLFCFDRACIFSALEKYMLVIIYQKSGSLVFFMYGDAELIKADNPQSASRGKTNNSHPIENSPSQKPF